MFEFSGKHLIQLAIAFGLLVFMAANWFIGAYKPPAREQPSGQKFFNPSYKSQSAASSSGNKLDSPYLGTGDGAKRQPKRKYPLYGNWR